MANLFAYRSTDPRELEKTKDPIGLENDAWLKQISKDAGIVIAAWGNHGSLFGRSREVVNMLPNLYCLKKTAPVNQFTLFTSLVPLNRS